MAKKTNPPSAPAAAPAERKKKSYSPAVQALLDVETANAVVAKNRIKEAKSLGKVLEALDSLSTFGLDQIETAITARREVLSAAT